MFMKKESIVKMLKTLKSNVTAVNVSIIETLISCKSPKGVKKQTLIDLILKNPKEFPERRIKDALISLNNNGVIMETKIKSIVRVNLTLEAWIELWGAVAGEKAAELIAESEKVLKDVVALAKTEGGKLKKKALKKLDKGVAYMKDEFRKASKK